MKEVLRTAEGRILKRFPKICKGGFYAAIRRLIETETVGNRSRGKRKSSLSTAEIREVIECYWNEGLKPGFYPDLYEIDTKNRVIHIFEIEDTHPLKDSKLRRLIWWWFSVDSNLLYDVELRVYDRYGMNERKLSLPNLYFELMIGAPPGSPAAQKTATAMGIKLDDLF